MKKYQIYYSYFSLQKQITWTIKTRRFYLQYSLASWSTILSWDIFQSIGFEFNEQAWMQLKVSH